MNARILGFARGSLSAIAIATTVSAASAQTPPPPAPVAAAAPQGAVAGQSVVTLSEGYVLGVGDVIEVSIPGRGDFQVRTAIQADGTVQLPYLNSVQAAGRTVLDFRKTISDQLQTGGYFANPAVNVNVATYASRYVVVLGEVATPGIVPVDRAYRLSELLARVGGPRESADDTITLRRVTGEEVSLNIQQVAMGGPEEDPVINPGDKLFVSKAETFYIYGQVSAPGTYRIDDEMTLRKALARGGGLTDRGSERRVKVYRGGEEIRVSPSDPITGGDVVVVGERFF